MLEMKTPGVATPQNTPDSYAPHLETLHDFFGAFSPTEAHAQLHKMMRSAFALKNGLTKKEVLDLLFLEGKLSKLLTAAEALAKNDAHKPALEKFFHHCPAAEWNKTLHTLLHAAIYDGFFTRPPNHDDIYHYCRELHAFTQASALIHDASKPAPENTH